MDDLPELTTVVAQEQGQWGVYMVALLPDGVRRNRIQVCRNERSARMWKQVLDRTVARRRLPQDGSRD